MVPEPRRPEGGRSSPNREARVDARLRSTARFDSGAASVGAGSCITIVPGSRRAAAPASLRCGLGVWP